MSEQESWHEDPQARRWLKDVKENMAPKMLDSAVVMSICTGEVDPKIAVELGYAILLDKPIIIGVMPGVTAPEHLVRAADEIVEFDPDNPEKTSAAMTAAMNRVLPLEETHHD